MTVLNRLQSVQRRAASREKAQIRTVTDEDERLTARGQPQADDPLQQMQIQEQRRQNLQELRERHQVGYSFNFHGLNLRYLGTQSIGSRHQRRQSDF